MINLIEISNEDELNKIWDGLNLSQILDANSNYDIQKIINARHCLLSTSYIYLHEQKKLVDFLSRVNIENAEGYRIRKLIIEMFEYSWGVTVTLDEETKKKSILPITYFSHVERFNLLEHNLYLICELKKNMNYFKDEVEFAKKFDPTCRESFFFKVDLNVKPTIAAARLEQLMTDIHKANEKIEEKVNEEKPKNKSNYVKSWEITVKSMMKANREVDLFGCMPQNNWLEIQRLNKLKTSIYAIAKRLQKDRKTISSSIENIDKIIMFFYKNSDDIKNGDQNRLDKADQLYKEIILKD